MITAYGNLTLKHWQFIFSWSFFALLSLSYWLFFTYDNLLIIHTNFPRPVSLLNLPQSLTNFPPQNARKFIQIWVRTTQNFVTFHTRNERQARLDAVKSHAKLKRKARESNDRLERMEFRMKLMHEWKQTVLVVRPCAERGEARMKILLKTHNNKGTLMGNWGSCVAVMSHLVI